MKLLKNIDPKDSGSRIAVGEALDAILNTFSTRLARDIVNTMHALDAPRLMNARQAGEYLGRSERWIRQETAAGRLECVREGNSRPRYDRATLDRYVEQRNGRD